MRVPERSSECGGRVTLGVAREHVGALRNQQFAAGLGLVPDRKVQL